MRGQSPDEVWRWRRMRQGMRLQVLTRWSNRWSPPSNEAHGKARPATDRCARSNTGGEVTEGFASLLRGCKGRSELQQASDGSDACWGFTPACPCGRRDLTMTQKVPQLFAQTVAALTFDGQRATRCNTSCSESVTRCAISPAHAAAAWQQMPSGDRERPWEQDALVDVAEVHFCRLERRVRCHRAGDACQPR